MRKATGLFFPEKADNRIVTHWLKRGKTLREMNNAEMQAIEGPNFWNQVGEWLLFGLAFGIADRHLDNWVWSHELQKLAMIDTEMSFQTNLGLSDYAALFHHAPKLRETWDMHMLIYCITTKTDLTRFLAKKTNGGLKTAQSLLQFTDLAFSPRTIFIAFS